METIVNYTALISHLAIGKQHSISKYHRNWQWKTFKSNNEQPILCSKYLVVIKWVRIFSTFVCIIRYFTCEKELQKQIDKQKMWYPNSNNKNRTFIQYHFAEKMGSSNKRNRNGFESDSESVLFQKNVWKIAQTANVRKWVFFFDHVSCCFQFICRLLNSQFSLLFFSSILFIFLCLLQCSANNVDGFNQRWAAIQR